METVTSKRHPVKFYGAVLFVSLFMLSIGSFLLFGFLKSPSDKPSAKIILQLAAAACIILAIYTVYAYFKNTPTIIIDRKFIYFSKKQYAIEDIVDIRFTGKEPFRYLGGFEMEGTAIEFEGMQRKVFYDSMYSNSSGLKLFLERVLAEEDLNIEPVKAVPPAVLSSEHFYFYRGSLFSSFRGISAIVLLGGSLLLLLNCNNFATTIFTFFMVWFFYALYGYTLYYFGINEKYFVVRNHLLFWKNTGYKLAHIKEVVFESQGKAPKGLRLIFHDYTSKLHQAGSLNGSHWKELQEELEKLNIKVRNEL